MRPYNNQTGMSNGFSQMLQSTNPMNEQRNVAEQAQAEEKRSLTALNYFISMYLVYIFNI